MAKESRIREVLTVALGAFGAKGAVREEIYSLICEDLYGDTLQQKRQSLSNGLFRAVEADALVKFGDRYFLKEYDPVPKQNRLLNISEHHGNGSVAKPAVALYAGKRTGKTVSIYTTPKVMDDVIALSLLMNEQWFKMPLFSSVRICIGTGDPPMWSSDQEMYRGVVQIRITHKSGMVTDEHTSPSDIITVAPEQE